MDVPAPDFDLASVLAARLEKKSSTALARELGIGVTVLDNLRRGLPIRRFDDATLAQVAHSLGVAKELLERSINWVARASRLRPGAIALLEELDRCGNNATSQIARNRLSHYLSYLIDEACVVRDPTGRPVLTEDGRQELQRARLYQARRAERGLTATLPAASMRSDNLQARR